jgi:hypothetical protein
VMHPFGSDRVANIRVPRPNYEFPAAWPQFTRTKVLAERLRAEDAFGEKKSSIREFADAEALLIDLILRVFVALAKEGYELGIQGALRVDELESECLRFLRSYTLEADLMGNGHTMPNAGAVEIRDDIRRKIETSEEWKTYRGLLIRLADAQAATERSSRVSPVGIRCESERDTSKSDGDPSSGKTLLHTAPPQDVADEKPFDHARAAKEARAKTVARIIHELDQLKPQMFEDESEYNRLRNQFPDLLTFKTAEQRPDLKQKVLAIRTSTRHVRLAQEIAAAHHGRQLSTIQDDWKDHKPPEFRRPR